MVLSECVVLVYIIGARSCVDRGAYAIEHVDALAMTALAFMHTSRSDIVCLLQVHDRCEVQASSRLKQRMHLQGGACIVEDQPALQKRIAET